MILVVIAYLKRCYIPVFWHTVHRFGAQESDNGKTCGLENAPSPTENVCRPEQEPLISVVKTDDIPLMSGSLCTKITCYVRKMCKTMI